MTYVVGLTGGIGSGKTVVSDYFSSLGVPIIDTDIIAREIVELGKPTLSKLIESFGKEILLDDGNLDRAALRKIAFSSEANTKLLNSITHPAIRLETLKKINSVHQQYCIVVVPLLNPDSPFKKIMHRVLLVTAKRNLKTERVKKRSNISTKEIDLIMQSQLNDDQRQAFADDVINNDGSIEDLHVLVDTLHQTYNRLNQT